MRILEKVCDGGKKSGVHAYFLIEWKGLFSIALLRFGPGSRDAYHSHAFDAITWVVRGHLTEHRRFPGATEDVIKEYPPSFRPKITTRDNMHKVVSRGVSWALTFRGPWAPEWKELRPDGEVTLTHGRRVVA